VFQARKYNASWCEKCYVDLCFDCFLDSHTNYSNLYIIQQVWGMEHASYMRKSLTKPNFQEIFSHLLSFNISIFSFKAKTTCSHFSSCMDVFLEDRVDWWVKDFRYTTTGSQIQLTSTIIINYCNGMKL
jgi:hypothetical protein